MGQAISLSGVPTGIYVRKRARFFGNGRRRRGERLKIVHRSPEVNQMGVSTRWSAASMLRGKICPPPEAVSELGWTVEGIKARDLRNLRESQSPVFSSVGGLSR